MMITMRIRLQIDARIGDEGRSYGTILRTTKPYLQSCIYKGVSTKIGKKNFEILKSEFPIGHLLRKIFNKNIVKHSRSCIPRVSNSISSQNTQLLSQPPIPTRRCNCRNLTIYPLHEECLLECIVHLSKVMP